MNRARSFDKRLGFEDDSRNGLGKLLMRCVGGLPYFQQSRTTISLGIIWLQ